MDAINVIAGLITILATSFTIYRWIRGRAVFMSRQDPAKPATRTLSLIDVQKGIDLLVAYAREYEPDYVYGVNRGGGIVGSWIAKQIGLPFIHLFAVNCDSAGERQVMADGPEMIPPRSKILLVDDAKRKGEHMRLAVAYLKRRFPSAEIRRVVMLEMHIPNPGPETDLFRRRPVECAAFKTYDARVLLPWDDPNIVVRTRHDDEEDAAA